MGKPKTLDIWKGKIEALACQRSVPEQIEWIRKFGNHGASHAMRAGVLFANGIPKAKEKAGNCVIFGCYRPFTTPFLVRDYVRLLEMLDIDYTYLDKEYCCGAPVVAQTMDGRPEEMRSAIGEFHYNNLDLAGQKGADKLIYCCAGCVHAAKKEFENSSDAHVYILDLILDGLEGRSLKIVPTVMGYFEGCKTIFSTQFKGAKVDWERYRRLLDRVEGLKIVDLPANMCCSTGNEQVIGIAEKLNLDKILCSCNWCYTGLMPAAKGRVQMVNMPELLLQCLEAGR